MTGPNIPIMKNIICLLFCAGLFIETLPAQDRFSDCAGAVILCDKSDLIVKKLNGPGKEPAEVGFTTCSANLEERNSVWMKWQVDRAGSIEFGIEPLQPDDDIDFVVYRLDGDIFGCSRKHEIRCLASGENVGAPEEDSYPCRGRTGLAKNVSDEQEGDGCGDRHDNYLAAIGAEAGEQYILYVNNYSSDNGFKLEWGGDATFRTPENIALPAADQTQMSRAIYFRDGYREGVFKTDWTVETIHRSFVAKVPDARVANTFVACLPADDNIVKTDRKAVFEFGQLYPNPSAGNVWISVSAPAHAVVRIEMFDLLGRVVFSREYIVDPGEQTLHLSVEQVRSGLYLCLLRAPNASFTRKLLINHP